MELSEKVLQVRRISLSLVTLILIGWTGFLANTAAAQSTGFVNEVVVPGITSATTIAFLPDGRMLVGELTGTIWVVQPGANAPDPTPFLQLSNPNIVAEQGLLDVLPDPNFAQNGRYYVFYTKGFPDGVNHNRVSRFTASGNTTSPSTEVVLWQDFWSAGNDHHGGTLAVGTDGKLYFTVGDGTFSFQVQNLSYYGGKVLRINLDGTIPTDNPFYDGAGTNKDEIWALGFRNPFRMSVDPVTGRMYEGDVGENSTTSSIEEVNLVTRGANYGWPLCEGSCGLAGMTNPIFQYVHPNHDAAIIGGVVYRGNQFPAQYVGSYFYGDYAQNFVRRLTLNANGTVASALNFWPADGSLDDPSVGDIVKLVVGPDGSLYFVDIGFTESHQPNPAAIRRIRYVAGDLPPVCVASAVPTTGPSPLQVAFSSVGSYDPEGASLSYLWTFGDGALTSQPNPLHTYAAQGPYTARLTVSDGSHSTLSNDLNITVGGPPVPAIQLPIDGSVFRAGDQISFAGSATDPDQGTLGAGALSWSVLFHHEDHIHPGGGPFPGSSGTFDIPTTGHDFSGNTSFEVILTATDATGLSRSTSVTIFPQKVNLTFSTSPAGLGVDIDGVRKTTPLILDSLIGFQHTIAAPQQTSQGTLYGFLGWSDGGTASHTVVTPASNQSYTAQFRSLGTPDLVAAYSFNEGSGLTASDASGNGNTGAIGSATWTTAGKHGGALSFDGAGARVTVSDAASLDLTTAMTLAAWVRPSITISYWSDVIYKGNDVYYLSASTPNRRPAAGGTFTEPPLEGTSTLIVNDWTHLATTYDGATLRLFVNGVEVASRAQTGPIATSTFPLEIGGDSLYGQSFAGAIDDVRVYARALSASEIQAAMNQGVGAPVLSPPYACGLGPELGLVVTTLFWLRGRRRPLAGAPIA